MHGGKSERVENYLDVFQEAGGKAKTQSTTLHTLKNKAYY